MRAATALALPMTPERRVRLTQMRKARRELAEEAVDLLEQLVGHIAAAAEVVETHEDNFHRELRRRNRIVVAFSVTPEVFDRLVCWHVNGDPETDCEHDGLELEPYAG